MFMAGIVPGILMGVALVILEAKPKPVEAPITNTRLGPLILPFDFTYSI
jgi:hypothetical protein